MLDNMTTQNLEILIFKLTKKSRLSEAEKELLRILIEERKLRQ